MFSHQIDEVYREQFMNSNASHAFLPLFENKYSPKGRLTQSILNTNMNTVAPQELQDKENIPNDRSPDENLNEALNKEINHSNRQYQKLQTTVNKTQTLKSKSNILNSKTMLMKDFLKQDEIMNYSSLPR